MRGGEGGRIYMRGSDGGRQYFEYKIRQYPIDVSSLSGMCEKNDCSSNDRTNTMSTF